MLNHFQIGKTTKVTTGNYGTTITGYEVSDAVLYRNASVINRSNTGSLGGSSSFVDYWVVANTTGESSNGYYAYKYNLTPLGELPSNSADGMYLNLSLKIGADDHLEAVYLNVNGTLESLYRKVANSGEAGYTGYGETQYNNGKEYVGSLSLENALGLWEANPLDLIFIVHNTGSGGATGSNATNLGVTGTFDLSTSPLTNSGGNPLTFGSTFPRSAATPEPATLLIFGCGIAGAGVAAIRRRRSK